MPELSIDANQAADNAALLIDGSIIGGITRTNKTTYTADTKGKIPAIDGITGSTVKDTWQAVVARVKQGGVQLIQPVTAKP